MKEFGVQPYDSINHTGLVRHIYIRKAFVTGQIMVCLVINGNVLPYADELCDDLMRFKDVKSIVINENTENTNVILGKNCTTLWGEDYIEDVMRELRIYEPDYAQYGGVPVSKVSLKHFLQHSLHNYKKSLLY